MSRECLGQRFDTPGTLSRHFLDTLEHGARRVPKTPHEAAVLPSAVVAKNMSCVFPPCKRAPLLKCLILMVVASVGKRPTVIMVTFLCGRVLSERALGLLLNGQLVAGNAYFPVIIIARPQLSLSRKALSASKANQGVNNRVVSHSPVTNVSMSVLRRGEVGTGQGE